MARRALAVVHRLLLVVALSVSAPGVLGIAYALPSASAAGRGAGVQTGGVTTLATDAIPGDPLSTADPQMGTVDEAPGSADDVFRFYLEVGQQIQFTLSVDDPGADVDLYLYGPAAVLLSDPYVASATGSAYPKTIAYTCVTSGYHNIDVRAVSGSSAYALAWDVTPGPGDNIPGVALTASPVHGTLDSGTNPDDVFYVDLAARDRLTLSLTGDAGTDFDVQLFAPGAASIYTATPVVTTDPGAYSKTTAYAVPNGLAGRYYVAVRSNGGSGAYTLTYSTTHSTDDDIPGSALGASPVNNSLNVVTDPCDVFYLDLAVGQTLNVSMTGAAGTDFDLQLFAPGAVSVRTATAIATSAGATYPETMSYTVPAGSAGRHYLAVEAYSGSGSFTLTWSVLQPVTALDIPGVALTASPVHGTLDGGTHPDDVYFVSLGERDRLTLTLTGDAGTDFDVQVFALGAASIYTATPVATTESGAYSKTTAFSVPNGFAGTYYVAVRSTGGSGAYTLTYSTSHSTDDDIPGSALGASPVSNSLNVVTDPCDVFSKYLLAGQTLNVSMTGAAGTDFDLQLFAPGAVSVRTATPVATSAGATYPETMSYTVPADGTYYLAVECYTGSGSGSYTLTYTVLQPAGAVDIPGVPLTPSPVSGTLDVDAHAADVFYVDLVARNRLTVTLTGDPGTDFDVQLFAPGAASISTAVPIDTTDPGAYPKTLTYTVPNLSAGHYYLAVRCNGDSGSYAVTYSVATGATDDDIPGSALGVSPISNSLNNVTDQYDVFYVDLTVGQTLDLSLTGAAGTDFDLLVFGLSAVSVRTSTAVATSAGAIYPETLAYTVPGGSGGRYYVAVKSYSGTGSYTLTYSVLQPAAALDIPGVVLTASPVRSTLDVDTHPADVYFVDLVAKDRLTVTLTGDSGTDFDLQFFAPGAASIYTATPVRETDPGAYPKSMTYTVPNGSAGRHYLAVRSSGISGGYTLTYSVIAGAADDDIPGTAIGTSPVSNSLNAVSDQYDVFYIDLVAGQPLNVSMTGAAGTDFDLQLFAPGAASVRTSTPAKEAATGTYPETLSYTVPAGAGGRYYLAVKDYSGTGSYTLTYSGATATSPLPVYRFYNLKQGVHFYTANYAEMLNVLNNYKSIYRFEGVAYTVDAASPANTTPLYRFYNLKQGVHFYTANNAEMLNVLNNYKSIYRFEGIAYYVATTPTGTTPVYRFFNLKQGVHFYTANNAEMLNVLNNYKTVYRFEGIGYYFAAP